MCGRFVVKKIVLPLSILRDKFQNIKGITLKEVIADFYIIFNTVLLSNVPPNALTRIPSILLKSNFFFIK